MSMMDKWVRPSRLILVSIISAAFITYPNIACLPWDMDHMPASEHSFYLLFFAFRYVFFVILLWVLIKYNLVRLQTLTFRIRLMRTGFIAMSAYLIYVAFSFLISNKSDCFGSILLFQFFVTWVVITFTGHFSAMYSEQRRKEQEIEKLTIENLRSRYDALTSQINPHFFFNSLNGISALVRGKKEETTLAYVNKLSDVFRYILQSEKKGLVTLEEELDFIGGFKYLMEVRFANKLTFNIDIDNKFMNLKLPVLSLLPLIDNVVNHNIIDSDHKMEITLRMNGPQELSVSNILYPKPEPPDTNGTGLRNLDNRFQLLMNMKIRVENNGKTFSVYLPLK